MDNERKKKFIRLTNMPKCHNESSLKASQIVFPRPQDRYDPAMSSHLQIITSPQTDRDLQFNGQA